MSKQVIDELLVWGRALAAGNEGPEEIGRRVGTVRSTVGAVLYITPANPIYGNATVTYDDKRRIRALEVFGGPEAALPTVAELEGRLGAYVQGVQQFRAPLPLIFTVDFGRDLERLAKVYANIGNPANPKTEWRVQGFLLVSESR